MLAFQFDVYDLGGNVKLSRWEAEGPPDTRGGRLEAGGVAGHGPAQHAVATGQWGCSHSQQGGQRPRANGKEPKELSLKSQLDTESHWR